MKRSPVRLIAVLVLVAAGALLARSQLAPADEKEAFGRLTIDDVEKKLGDKAVHLFDNNSRDTWSKEHVPGAVWVNYKDVQARDLPADKNDTLIFYCANDF